MNNPIVKMSKYLIKMYLSVPSKADSKIFRNITLSVNGFTRLRNKSMTHFSSLHISVFPQSSRSILCLIYFLVYKIGVSYYFVRLQGQSRTNRV